MEPAVLAALITAAASLLVALLTARRQAEAERAAEASAQRQAETQQHLELLHDQLDRLREQDTHRRTAKAELDHLREPLAAVDLGQRLYNIRRRGFLAVYLTSRGSRERLALLGTLYRLAVYLTVVEDLRLRTSLLHFESDADTREVQTGLVEVGKILKGDQYGARFMLWQEQQRAIAERMRDGTGGHLGFATFAERYESRFQEWLGGIAEDLNELARDPKPHTQQRLTLLQLALGALADRLDIQPVIENEWRYLIDDQPQALRPPVVGDRLTL